VGTAYGPKTAPVCEPKAHYVRAATRRDPLFQPWSGDPGQGAGPSRGLGPRITAQFKLVPIGIPEFKLLPIALGPPGRTYRVLDLNPLGLQLGMQAGHVRRAEH
jgi:hypothetical protein